MLRTLRKWLPAGKTCGELTDAQGRSFYYLNTDRDSFSTIKCSLTFVSDPLPLCVSMNTGKGITSE